MDPGGRIYEANEESIPAEDKARLDGYLKARSEADALKTMEERYRALEEMLMDK